MKQHQIRKAVIPVAGLGTRMLPATKAIPKEMLPVVDKPLIQYVVSEAIAAGIKEIVLVTHATKNSIENHFDTSFELEAQLERRVKRQLLEAVQSICPKDVTIISVRQSQAKGLGHAILCAKSVVGDAPFAALLPDVIIDEASCDLRRDNLAAMVALFDESTARLFCLNCTPRYTRDATTAIAATMSAIEAHSSMLIFRYPRVRLTLLMLRVHHIPGT